MRAVLATLDVTAERPGATNLDRSHDAALSEAYVTGIGRAPRRPVVAEDIRDLQNGTPHDRRRYAGGRSPGGFSGVRRSSGLTTCLMVLVATRV